LQEKGLVLSHEKTRITHIEDGFDFLGQTIRRYRCGKVLLKPSRRSVRTFLAEIRETIDRSGSMSAGEMIWRLNQQIKGWTMYHRHAASKRTYTPVDRRIFRMVWHWCRRRHRRKSWTWIKEKYFQRVDDKDWVFTATLRDRKGRPWPIRLMEAAKVRITTHVKIRSEANPYDPQWELYLEARASWKLSQTLAGRGRIEYLWKEQRGRCLVCARVLHTNEEPWHIHHRLWRSLGGSDTADNLELLHANCHRQIHARREG
jgi:RNA-directed DNA polymerase